MCECVATHFISRSKDVASGLEMFYKRKKEKEKDYN